MRNSMNHYKNVSAAIAVDGKRDPHRLLLHISRLHMLSEDMLVVLLRKFNGQIFCLLIHDFVWFS